MDDSLKRIEWVQAQTQHLTPEQRLEMIKPRNAKVAVHDGDQCGFSGGLSIVEYVKPSGQPCMPLYPLYNRILLRAETVDTHSAGGIELPQEMIEREELFSTIWQLIAVGPTAFLPVAPGGIALASADRPDYVPRLGDWLHIKQYAGQKARVVDEAKKTSRTWRIIEESEVLAIAAEGVKLDHRVR